MKLACFKGLYLNMQSIDISAFHQCQILTGTVLSAEPFPEAQKPAIKLLIDFGPFGQRKSSAQITRNYLPQNLIGKTIIALVNIPPRRIAGFLSECLVLGAVDPELGVVLLTSDQSVPPGTPIA
ncbi:MAG: tRNA-binding protein [Bacteroidota bacterium]